MARYALIVMVMLSASSAVQAIDLDGYRMVDLTHPYNADTIYWPTSPSKFKLEMLAEGQTSGGWF